MKVRRKEEWLARVRVRVWEREGRGCEGEMEKEMGAAAGSEGEVAERRVTAGELSRERSPEKGEERV